MKSRAWLGDLIRGLGSGADDAELDRAGRWLGLTVRPAEPPISGELAEAAANAEAAVVAESGVDHEQPGDQRGLTLASEPVSIAPHAPTIQWRPVRAFDVRPLPLPVQPPVTPASVEIDTPYERRPRPGTPLLAPWSRLSAALDRAFRTPRASHAIAVDALVANWSRLRFTDRLPRRVRAPLPSRAFVWVDTTPALSPYLDDQDDVVRRVRRWLGPRAVAVRWLGTGPYASMRDLGGKEVRGLRELRRGDVVLCLSDLGVMHGVEAEEWRDVGRRLRRRGVGLVALMPCRVRGGPRLPEAWSVVTWQRAAASGDPERRRRQAENLLELVSATRWVERGLLRSVRLAAGLDALAESDVWMGDAVDPCFPGVVWILEKHVAALRSGLAERDPELRERVQKEIERWHAGPQVEELWISDLITLRGLGATVSEEEVAHIERFAAKCLRADAGEGVRWPWVARWLRSVERTFPDTFESPGFLEMFKRAHADDPEIDLPEWVRRMGGWDGAARAPGAWSLVQQGDRLALRGHGEATRGSRFAVIDAWRPTLEMEVPGERAQVRRLGRSVEDLALPSAELFAQAEPPADVVDVPEWAHEAGRDEYGVWAAVRLRGVELRMRWIEPGTATLGSPEDEVRRDVWDQAQREVRFDEGFWLAETPTTQALWRAVMGDNPSEYVGDERPVESVSWEDVQRFIAALEVLRPGLCAGLPSEEAWEFAYRAGTTSATHDGDLEIRDDGTAAVLNDIAWYPKMSGAETKPVALKSPNAWGLHDMLGNVWEWTESLYEGGSHRVLRGGALYFDAQLVRAIDRVAGRPGERSSYCGFRLSRGPVRPGGAGTGRGPAAGAEPLQASTASREASLREPSGAQPAARTGAHSPLPRPSAAPRRSVLTLRTDRTVLELEAMPKPPWAVAYGRDRFGLWADQRIGAAQVRLRWIPPGRFVMGSPKDGTLALSDDRPPHEVLLTAGYWLADVPCTQAVWSAVAGAPANPSRFKSPQRPVDTVSWKEVQTFLEQLEAQEKLAARGFEPFDLPTEAQWEYACRAGTTDATYAGPLMIRGANDAPVLDDIAWYRGNSGVGWDLPANQGEHSSDWPEKQHAHTRAGSRDVGLKAPNPWGLYDMLGNVWEWCRDGLRDYGSDSVRDLKAALDMRSYRVLRGGAWDIDAGRVCAAHRRYAYHPGLRHSSIGFRLSRGPVRQEQEAERGQDIGAEPPVRSGPARSAPETKRRPPNQTNPRGAPSPRPRRKPKKDP